MSTFVSVGNATQPFVRLLKAVASVAAQLPQPVIIQYGAARGFALAGCACTDFFSMEEFASHVAAAELLIMHAGAGSVIHAVHSGKVPVVVPRLAGLGEHVDDHQLEFARELARLGKVVVYEERAQLLEVAQAALRKQEQASSNLPPPPLLAELESLLQQHVRQLNGKSYKSY